MIDVDATEVIMAKALEEATASGHRNRRPIIYFDYEEEVAEERWCVRAWLPNIDDKNCRWRIVVGESFFSVLWIALELAGVNPAPIVEKSFEALEKSRQGG